MVGVYIYNIVTGKYRQYRFRISKHRSINTNFFIYIYVYVDWKQDDNKCPHTVTVSLRIETFRAKCLSYLFWTLLSKIRERKKRKVFYITRRALRSGREKSVKFYRYRWDDTRARYFVTKQKRSLERRHCDSLKKRKFEQTQPVRKIMTTVFFFRTG